jgi:acetyl-CoA C-acetyltransferase
MDRHRPVIVGVGQLANKDEERMVAPLDLIEAATRAAVDDAGVDLLAHVGAVLCPPSSVMVVDEDVPAALAARLGLAAGIRRQSAYSGAAPQELVAQAAEAIADGRIEAALIAGGIADASVRRARARGLEPPAPPTAPWSQGSAAAAAPATPPPRPRGYAGELAAGVFEPVASFAMAESVLAAAAGRSFDQQRVWLGTVLAPFTAVAARRPDLAWFPVAREPGDLSEVRPDNRLVSGPYTKLMTSFPTVDLAAAILVVSEALADRLGVAQDRRVYPWAAAACHEPHPPSERPRLDQPPAATAAGARVLAAAGVTIDQVDLVDLYSCFPAAVQIGAAALGVPATGLERAPLTVTGGLPYFGGPGASYTAHAIACMVEECRARPGALGVVFGLGGLISSFAAGIYSTVPGERPWAFDECADVEDELAGRQVTLDLAYEGPGTVEAMTVTHHRDTGPASAPVFVRLPDGSRSAARPADPELAAVVATTNLVGRTVQLHRDGKRVLYELT